MADNSPSAHRSRARWQGFKRAEIAMYNAVKIFHGTGDVDGTLKAAKRIQAYFDKAAQEAAEQAEDEIPRVNGTLTATEAMKRAVSKE